MSYLPKYKNFIINESTAPLIENGETKASEPVSTGDRPLTSTTNQPYLDKQPDNRFLVQWANIGTGMYMPTSKTVPSLSPGVYTVEANNSGTFAKKVNINSDEIIELPNPMYKEIIKNVIDFYKLESKFIEWGYNHKRGILMYGKPGNGKSFIINYLIKYLMDNEDMLIFIFPRYAPMFEEFIYKLREVEPKRKILVIMEDLDGLLQDYSNKTAILNLLDGIKQVNNICYIATTNYVERLSENIANRPSRFDKKYEITAPDEATRKAYFDHKIPSKYKVEIDLDQWIKDTEGLSMSHLRELIISVFLFGWDFKNALNHLKSMSSVEPKNENWKEFYESETNPFLSGSINETVDDKS